MNNLSLRSIKGVGEKTEKLFAKLGVSDTEALLHYYPRDYIRYDSPLPVNQLKTDKIQAVYLRIISPVILNNRGRKPIVTTEGSDESGQISLIWYNMPFLKNTIRRGSSYILRGRVIMRGNKLFMEHPEIYTPAQYQEIENTLSPVYGLTAGLSNKTITRLIRDILKEKELYQEYLPDMIREQGGMVDINFAMAKIHFPKNEDELLPARKRLVFDEFLIFVLAVQLLKEKTAEEENHFPMEPTWTTEDIIESLPYSLTKAQTNTWKEIERDLISHSLMSRLVQGDVGSGKTILAFLAMILTAENGYQSALMVPTEVLARQHYQSLCDLLSTMKSDGSADSEQKFRPVLLTGSVTARQKREIYSQIEDGSVNLIIGTHALIQEKVIYKDLALVITDEQHRFGVRQREALTSRGAAPHVLVMSATPIPRTLSIILYGDLDISVIDELPAKRLPIKNCVVDTGYRPKAYSFIERQVREGRQVYVICPMVEESEGLDAENVLDYTSRLRDILPEDIHIEYLHGKMKAKEKNKIMEDFAHNEIQVLVSTTVIEVGVNVPNATVMMVENAERFGLAQLHQLRGRVGRGQYQSYCIFMKGVNADENSRRLEILNKSNDGFRIAEEDLRLRGPGDMFGVRQSGDLNFQIADIYNDYKVLIEASQAAGNLLSLDPDLSLPQHRPLRRMVDSYLTRASTGLSL